MSSKQSEHAPKKAGEHQFSPLHLFTGAVAGAVSRTATNPLERLKILRQVTTVEYRGLSLTQAFSYMWKEEGWRGMFKGNGVNIVKVAPFSAFEFFFYELFKHTFYHGRPAIDYTSKLVCGGLTGIAAQTLGITPFIGIKMTSFDLLKANFLPDKNSPTFDVWNLFLGALAGTIAVTLTYPTDLIRRLLQLSGKPGHIEYKGMWDCTSRVYKADGFPGLFKGLWPCYLKVALSKIIKQKLKMMLIKEIYKFGTDDCDSVHDKRETKEVFWNMINQLALHPMECLNWKIQIYHIHIPILIIQFA